MQDQDAPPVEEGETDGDVVVVQEAQIPAVVRGAINSIRGSIALPWITATARRWLVEIMALASACAPASHRIIRRPSLNLCRCARTPTPASLLLWMTSSFRQRFRKLPAS